MARNSVHAEPLRGLSSCALCAALRRRRTAALRAAKWLGDKKGRLLTAVLYNQSLLILRGRKVIRCASRHILRLVLGITVLERVKRWVLAMLARNVSTTMRRLGWEFRLGFQA